MLSRYYSLADHNINSLEQSYFYLSSPSNYNDPFDCKTRLIRNGSESQWKSFLKERDPKIPNAEVNQLASIYANKNIPVAPEEIEKLKNSHGVISFSTTKRNILMWSHYAENHKGFVLVFASENVQLSDTESKFKIIKLESEQLKFSDEYKDFRSNLFLQKVDYNSKLPEQFNLFNLDSDNGYIVFSKFFTTKYKSWEYEREFRFLSMTHQFKEDRKVYFNKSSLKSIIFGSKMPIDKKQTLLKIIQNNYFSKGFRPQILETFESENAFRLGLKKIKI